MRKLFYFLSIALVLMTTSCQNEDTKLLPDDPTLKNDGEENVLYTYYSATQYLCGSSIETVGKKLTNLGMTDAGKNRYEYVGKEYVIVMEYSDVDSNGSIDIFNVTFTPAEQKHEAVLTFDCIKKFVTAVDNDIKLFATSTKCRYYGFYSAEGKWLGAMGDVKSLFSSTEVNEKSIRDGYVFWIDNAIESYDPATPTEFTGMYLNPKASTTEGEYDIVMSFAINQKL